MRSTSSSSPHSPAAVGPECSGLLAEARGLLRDRLRSRCRSIWQRRPDRGGPTRGGGRLRYVVVDSIRRSRRPGRSAWPVHVHIPTSAGPPSGSRIRPPSWRNSDQNTIQLLTAHAASGQLLEIPLAEQVTPERRQSGCVHRGEVGCPAAGARHRELRVVRRAPHQRGVRDADVRRLRPEALGELNHELAVAPPKKFQYARSTAPPDPLAHEDRRAAPPMRPSRAAGCTATGGTRSSSTTPLHSTSHRGVLSGIELGDPLSRERARRSRSPDQPWNPSRAWPRR